MGRGPGIIGGPSQLKAPLQAAKSFNLAAQQAFDCIGGDLDQRKSINDDNN